MHLTLRVATSAFLSIVAVLAPCRLARADDSNSLDEFRSLYQELRGLMDENLDEATEFLESKIKNAPKSPDLQFLRESLANKLLDDGQYDEASSQIERLLDFQIDRVGNPKSQYGVWMTVQTLVKISDQSGNTETLEGAVDRVLQAIENAPTQVPIPMAELVVLKAHLLVDSDSEEQATSLVKKHLAKLSEVNSSDTANEESVQAHVRMLRSLTSSNSANDSWRDEYVKQLESTVADALKSFPKSKVLQRDFADVQFQLITRWGQDDPEANKKRIESTVDTISAFAAANPTVLATLRRIELYQERMASVKPVETLVGKMAPDWDVDAWVNGDNISQESVKGKVILLDFWAMWCGPCIATFPHLREWREEFGDEDFEIVGVTTYYNYEWDEKAKRASQAKEDVSNWNERDTIKKFLDHHKLKHPVLLTPKESEMSSEYGVRGIPHVVLIDQNGIVQLVKTGAGKETASAIHNKIKELLKR